MVSIIFRFSHLSDIRKVEVHNRDISFENLLQLVRSLFDFAPDTPIQISYSFNKFDNIIENEEELKIALSHFPLLIKIKVSLSNAEKTLNAEESENIKKNNIDNQLFNWKIPCEVCEQNIYGLRYRCFCCSNFSICKNCLKYTPLTHPPHHYFVQLQDPGFELICEPSSSVFENIYHKFQSNSVLKILWSSIFYHDNKYSKKN